MRPFQNQLGYKDCVNSAQRGGLFSSEFSLEMAASIRRFRSFHTNRPNVNKPQAWIARVFPWSLGASRCENFTPGQRRRRLNSGFGSQLCGPGKGGYSAPHRGLLSPEEQRVRTGTQEGRFSQTSAISSTPRRERAGSAHPDPPKKH